jgi:hypothetical protein
MIVVPLMWIPTVFIFNIEKDRAASFLRADVIVVTAAGAETSNLPV